MNYRKDPNRENNSMVLEWTGERYLPFVDPKICGAEIHYEHLHRYYFALHFVKEKKSLIWLAEKAMDAIPYQNLPNTLLGWILMS